VKKPIQPLLVAIVGGSGSGKTWLGDKLQSALGAKAGRLSLDDFYRDRSHLSAARRERINFDNPAAIDWMAFETTLNRCLHGKRAKVPRYYFKTHCRLQPTILKPNAIMLVDGLWLLRSPRIRKFFGFRIFLSSPMRLRLRRRLARDIAARARRRKSVQEQFRRIVEPMHRKFVAPQIRWADVVVSGRCTEPQLQSLATKIVEHLRFRANRWH